MGSTMPLGMNIAVFPITLRSSSFLLSYSVRCTKGIKFSLKGKTAEESNLRSGTFPLTRDIGKKTNRMMTARFTYISRRTASRFHSIRRCFTQTTILHATQISAKNNSNCSNVISAMFSSGDPDLLR